VSDYTRVIRDAVDLDIELGVGDTLLCLGSVRSATLARDTSLTVVGALTGEARIARESVVLVYGALTGTLRLEPGSAAVVQGELQGRGGERWRAVSRRDSHRGDRHKRRRQGHSRRQTEQRPVPAGRSFRR
jgi:hypothetical protein